MTCYGKILRCCNPEFIKNSSHPNKPKMLHFSKTTDYIQEKLGRYLRTAFLCSSL